MSSADPEYKDLGNSEFKKGAYLKAAALYTKGLKGADPSKAAVLYSNRCACLLKLHKLDKALGDAKECVRLRGDWDKSHFRLGSALEALGRPAEALAAFRKAKECNPGSAEVAAKLQVARGSAAGEHSVPAENVTSDPHSAAAAADGGGGGGGAGARLHTAQVTAKVTSDTEYAEAKAAMVAGTPHEYSEARVLRFAAEVRAAMVEQLQSAAAGGPQGGAVSAEEHARGGAEGGLGSLALAELAPCVYFLPGRRGGAAVEQWGQVRVAAAFHSPDTLASALDFLRQYAADTDAHAACAVVPRRDVAFPQARDAARGVWKKRGWQLGSADGCFVQLEARGLRRVWFVQPGADAAELSEDFKLLEPLFR